VPGPVAMTAVRPSRPRRRGERAVSMTEFALIAPLFFLLLLGIIVAGIVIANQMQLTNAVRDGVRAAAICGGAGTNLTSTNTTLPNGATCSSKAVADYVNSKLVSIPGGINPQVTVTIDGSATNPLTSCQAGQLVEVDGSFAQPLYLPLIGRFLGDTSNSTVRTLHASAQATCEQ
jgi:Flp pilus assembly protein TadG